MRMPTPNNQEAARTVMLNFIRAEGGKESDMRRAGHIYLWAAPDGRTASIGWL